MSYTTLIPIDMGTGNSGLTLNAKLFDTAGAQSGSTITTGFADLGNGAYSCLATIPDNFRGTFKAFKATDESMYAVAALNPEGAEGKLNSAYDAAKTAAQASALATALGTDLINASVPPVLYRPSAGSTTVKITFELLRLNGGMDTDSDAGSLGLSVTDSAGTDVSSRCSAITGSGGIFTFNYTLSATDVLGPMQFMVGGLISTGGTIQRTYSCLVADPLATAASLATVSTNVSAIQTVLSGITSLAKWFRALFRKDTPDSTALSEINTGGGSYDATTDSAQAIRDRGDAAWTGGGGGSGDVIEA